MEREREMKGWKWTGESDEVRGATDEVRTESSSPSGRRGEEGRGEERRRRRTGEEEKNRRGGEEQEREERRGGERRGHLQTSTNIYKHLQIVRPGFQSGLKC